MAGEIPFRGTVVPYVTLPLEQCIPVKNERALSVGNRVAIQGARDGALGAQYAIDLQLGKSYHGHTTLRARVIKQNATGDAPEYIVLSPVKPAIEEDVTGNTRTEKLAAIRRIDIPWQLQQENTASVVPSPYGFLQVQDNQGTAIGTYTLSEYFGEKNLEEKLAEMGGKADPQLLAQIILNVGGTLAVAHSLGIVHRDVKPSNIQLRDIQRNDYAALTDWETAYQLQADPNDFAWGIGSPGYMPQEQYLSYTRRDAAPGERHRDYTLDLDTIAKAVKPRFDMYAFGMTLYEMVGGEVPNFNNAMMESIETGVPLGTSLLKEAELQQLCARFPNLGPVLIKATAINPDNRYQSMKDMLMDLRSFFYYDLGYDQTTLQAIDKYLFELPDAPTQGSGSKLTS